MSHEVRGGPRRRRQRVAGRPSERELSLQGRDRAERPDLGRVRGEVRLRQAAGHHQHEQQHHRPRQGLLREVHGEGPGASDACKKAIAASGLSSNDLFAKFGTPARPSTETRPTTTPTTAPKTTVSAETYALIAKCFQLYTAISTTGDSKAASDACAAAIKASGMSATDFWAKFGKELTSTTKPTTKPEPTATAKPVTNTAELSQLVAKCLQLYAAITSTGDTHAASEACGAAIRASGMSSADFWAKYHPTTN